LVKKGSGRRSTVSQLAIMVSIWLMSTVNPQANIDNLELMAIGAVLLGFSSATQDIVIFIAEVINGVFWLIAQF
jgi:PAT family beta-lactamase induction signal transducer AmpG